MGLSLFDLVRLIPASSQAFSVLTIKWTKLQLTALINKTGIHQLLKYPHLTSFYWNSVIVSTLWFETILRETRFHLPLHSTVPSYTNRDLINDAWIISNMPVSHQNRSINLNSDGGTIYFPRVCIHVTPSIKKGFFLIEIEAGSVIPTNELVG